MANLTNAAVNAVARSGVCFLPVEGNGGTGSCTNWTAQIGTVWYLAVFNYGTNSATAPVNFARAGIPSNTSTANDLCAGTTISVSGSMSISLGAKQAKLFKLGNGTTPPTPSAPTGLAATAASYNQINLSWTASSGASSYNVKRATVSGGQYTNVATAVATTSYLDGVYDGLSPSTTYYYVVSAVNDSTESTNSGEVSAETQPLPVPPAPGGLGEITGNSQVALAWTAAPLASSYNVKRATVSGGSYTNLASPTNTSYTDTAAVNGTTYFYVVSAVNGSGESTNSPEVSATPINAIWVNDTDPGITYSGAWATAQVVALEIIRMTCITLRRTGNYAQYTFTGTGIEYITELDTSEGNADIYLDGVYQVTVNCGATTTRLPQQVLYSAQNLVSGSHTIKIVMDSGTYMLLDAFAYTLPSTPPPSPTGLRATPGDVQATLNWNAAVNATGYNVKRSTKQRRAVKHVSCQSDRHELHRQSAVVNGTTYFYVVSAVNAWE